MRIEGASPEQRAALERILAGMPGTRIEALLVSAASTGWATRRPWQSPGAEPER